MHSDAGALVKLDWNQVERIRKQRREGVSISTIAAALNLARKRVYRICTWRTYREQPVEDIGLDSLGLHRAFGKCPTCEQKRAIMTKSGRCVECEVAELIRAGKVKTDGPGR